MTTDQQQGESPDFDSVTLLSPGNPLEQDAEFKEAHEDARQYLSAHRWVLGIEEDYLGAAIPGIVYIFLFKIRPARPDVDTWIWVIVGDLPPAYITIDVGKTPVEALDGYIGAMEKWVEAVLAGQSVAELIPVNVPPTREYAEMLGSRLEFLDEKILPDLAGEGEEAEGEAGMAEVPYEEDEQPDLDSVTPLTPEQDAEVKAAHREAHEYLRSLGWPGEIEEEYLGAAINGIVYIFLFKIRVTDEEEDIPWVWVIVGDIPPAHMLCYLCKTPSQALAGYIEAMDEWVEAALNGESVEDSIPVNVPPTRENAEMLRSRLRFLEQKVLPTLQGGDGDE
jgi:hypothetical protein